MKSGAELRNVLSRNTRLRVIAIYERGVGVGHQQDEHVIGYGEDVREMRTRRRRDGRSL